VAAGTGEDCRQIDCNRRGSALSALGARRQRAAESGSNSGPAKLKRPTYQTEMAGASGCLAARPSPTV
jgi:hypothetical protein